MVNATAAICPDEMTLEDMADFCEHIDGIADATEHARQHMLPKPKAPRGG